MKAAIKAAVAFEDEKIKAGKLPATARGNAAKREKAAGATGAAPKGFAKGAAKAADGDDAVTGDAAELIEALDSVRDTIRENPATYEPKQEDNAV